jgi:Na+/pantothenate symporter
MTKQITRIMFAVSLLANGVLGVQIYQISDRYNALDVASDRFMQRYELLRAWACEHGNGGYECGEE